ncbi:MAG: 2-phospho-L-lactate guanylyltransferase [Candidatus Helarchaeota archaeon]
MSDRIIAIIPVKNFHYSKLRLAHILSDSERQKFAYLMLQDVLFTLKQIPSIIKIVITTPSDNILRFKDQKIKILVDSAPSINIALDNAINYCKRFNASYFLILPSDIPLINKQDIENMLETKKKTNAQIIIVPSNRNDGTNSLLFDADLKIKTFYGNDSFRKHISEFKNKFKVKIFNSFRIGLDIDYKDDLDALYKFTNCNKSLALSYLISLNFNFT